MILVLAGISAKRKNIHHTHPLGTCLPCVVFVLVPNDTAGRSGCPSSKLVLVYTSLLTHIVRSAQCDGNNSHHHKQHPRLSTGLSMGKRLDEVDSPVPVTQIKWVKACSQRCGAITEPPNQKNRRSDPLARREPEVPHLVVPGRVGPEAIRRHLLGLERLVLVRRAHPGNRRYTEDILDRR